MKGAVLYGKGDLRVEEVSPRSLESGEVRMAVCAALTCGTDLKVYKRGYHAKMITPPAVLGHEMAGVIAEVAPDVTAWQVGDRVVVANSAPCDDCFFCRAGERNLCEDLLFLNGAYGESVIIPARIVGKNLLRLSPETPFENAALVEPLACVILGLHEAKIESGQRVLVIGAGPIGLMFARLVRNRGCEVTVAGRGRERLEAARALGAEHTIAMSSNEAQSDTLGRVAPRHGWDRVIEAVGKPETWEASLQAVRAGGVVNLFGGCPSGTQISLDTSKMHYGSMNLKSSFHHTPETIREALRTIESGIIRAKDFVNGECGLDELPTLFQSMARGNRAVKTWVRIRD